MMRIARAHVDGRTILIEEFKLVFMPVPKAAWTAMLWALAPLAGLTADDFARSTKPEVSPAMSVHDMRVWERHGRLLRDAEPARREALLQNPDWLRLTVARDPARRLWSGWQSKILLREPLYYGFHRDKSWFPQPPTDVAHVLADFRSFIKAFAAGFADDTKMRDAHWAPQADVIDLVPLNHIGCFERIADTQTVLQEHVAKLGGPTLSFGRANETPLPYAPFVYDEESAATVRQMYQRDYDLLGYEPVHGLSPQPDDIEYAKWSEHAEQRFPQMRDLIDRHQRLHGVVDGYRSELRKSEAATKRIARSLKAAEGERTRARAEVQRLQARHDRLMSSVSWRMTAPLRWVRSAFHRGPR